MVAFVFCAFVLAALCWVTLFPRDAWPFSSYPMFAHYRSERAVCVHRMRFVLPDGSSRPLPKSIGRLADEFHRDFAAVWTGGVDREIRSKATIEHFRHLAIRCDAKLATAARIEILTGIIQLGASNGARAAERVVLVYEPATGRLHQS